MRFDISEVHTRCLCHSLNKVHVMAIIQITAWSLRRPLGLDHTQRSLGLLQ